MSAKYTSESTGFHEHTLEPFFLTWRRIRLITSYVDGLDYAKEILGRRSCCEGFPTGNPQDFSKIEDTRRQVNGWRVKRRPCQSRRSRQGAMKISALSRVRR